MRKRDRHKIYKKIQEHIKMWGWQHRGFCFQLGRFTSTESIRRFPELERHRPKKETWSGYWWRTRGVRDKKREAILEKAIEETKPKVSYKKKKTKANIKASKRKK